MEPRTCLLALVVASSSIGCAGILKDTAKEVTPSVVSGAVSGLAQPDTQRDLLAITDQARVEALTKNVTGGLVDGMLDTLEDPARAQREQELADRLFESALASLEDPKRRARVEALVGGIAGSAVGAAVDSTFSHALDERVQQRMRAVMRDTVGDLVGVVFSSVRAEMGTSEARQKELGALARELSKGATLGFQDALDEAKRQHAAGEVPKSDGALLIAAGDAASTGSRIGWMLLLGLGSIALALLLALVWAVRKNRSRRAELIQRDEALLLLTEAIQSTATEPWSAELRAALDRSMRDGKAGDHVRNALNGKSSKTAASTREAH